MNHATAPQRIHLLKALANQHAGLLKWSGVVLTVASLLIFARSLPLDRAMDDLQSWIAGFGPWSIVLFIAIYAIATLLLLPGWIFTVTSGATFGLAWGMVAASLGSTTGAALAFLVARYLARDAVAKRIRQSPRFAAVDRAIAERGWKIVALLRLSPVVPFNLQNYLYGLTGIRFVPYVVTSWITMLPGAFFYVYIGYLGRAGLEAGIQEGPSVGVWTWILRGVGLLATFAVTVYIARLARRAMREATTLEADVPTDAAEPSSADASQPRALLSWPWMALASLALGLVLFATALWSLINPDAFRRPMRPQLDHSSPIILNDVHGRRHADFLGKPDFSQAVLQGNVAADGR